ncbi:phage tail sheath subtilisin-like domain-containing protein [Ramlibacter sp. PS3R-8]|uniref:phage tail sheath family protein n=1 Tax=Ramlibacter sp. PS3R-8 TaxID=3133437 RepID=UPI00309E67A8
MRIFDTPGVYSERADADAGGVLALRSDVAGFVGMARRGPLHLPVPLASFRQFQAWFGDPFDGGYLALAARAFFDNGGSRLWAVRVASEVAAVATRLLGAGGTPAWRIEASSPGVWGNDLEVRIHEQRRSQSRARPLTGDPLRLRVERPAGYAVHALAELRQAGLPAQRAFITAVDAAAGVLTLDRGLSFDPAAPATLETIAYAFDVLQSGRRVLVAEDLELAPEHPRYGPAVLCQPWQVVDRRAPAQESDAQVTGRSDAALQFMRSAQSRPPVPPPPILLRELRPVGAGLARPTLLLDAQPEPLALQGGADGLAALSVEDFIGLPGSPLDGDATRIAARRGLRALAAIEECALLAVPDIHIQPRPPLLTSPPPACVPDPCLPQPVLPPPRRAAAVGDDPPRFDEAAIERVQAALITLAEQSGDRIALLDAPYAACTEATAVDARLRAWRGRFDSSFAALYAPWLKVLDPQRPSGATRAVPPSGHVAGLIAALELKRGVHVSPANEALVGAQDVTLAIDEARHGLLNALHVNVIRALPGRGLRPMGARTLSSDPSWRFLGTRRVMCAVRRALAAALPWAVFEPNDWRTRAKLALVAGSFLQGLWARGVLPGAAPNEAYFVRCDDGNNPSAARDRGELLMEIGIAPATPFEFVLLRIGRDANGLAIVESGLESV